MRRNAILAGAALVLILMVGGIYFGSKIFSGKQDNILTNSAHLASSNTNAVNQNSNITQYYFFPLTDYFSRIKVKKFGQLVKVSDKFDVPCGADFSGYHDGDDLETTAAEANVDVAVHAVAAGKISQVGHVSGYGGLLVQSASLKDEDVTVYYGHINYLTAKVANGDAVTPGEVIAFLGKGCSSETDGERKHLHFAIHSGTVVDVRGYVPDKKSLDSWINPGETLKNIGAVSP